MWMPVRRLIGAGYRMSAERKREPQTMSTRLVGHRVLEAMQFAGVVLAVAVHLHHALVPVLVARTRNPACTAPPMPRLNGSRTTWAPARSASVAVSSVEPSSTTRTSNSGAVRWSVETTSAIVADSL